MTSVEIINVLNHNSLQPAWESYFPLQSASSLLRNRWEISGLQDLHTAPPRKVQLYSSIVPRTVLCCQMIRAGRCFATFESLPPLPTLQPDVMEKISKASCCHHYYRHHFRESESSSQASSREEVQLFRNITKAAAGYPPRAEGGGDMQPDRKLDLLE